MQLNGKQQENARRSYKVIIKTIPVRSTSAAPGLSAAVALNDDHASIRLDDNATTDYNPRLVELQQ